jgi:hypothetical protein
MLVVVTVETGSEFVSFVSTDLMIDSTLIQTALPDGLECWVRATSNRTLVDV